LEYSENYTNCQARTFWFQESGDRPTVDTLNNNNNLLNNCNNNGNPCTCADLYQKWAQCQQDASNCDTTLFPQTQNPSPIPPTCICSLNFNIEKDMSKSTFAYYRLTDYYQNHRRYVKSRDDVQLLAATNERLREPSSDCSPYDFDNQIPIAPCGAIANSLFNDTFFVYDCAENTDCTLSDNLATMWTLVRNPDVNQDGINRINMNGQDIAWQTDKTQKFDPNGNSVTNDGNSPQSFFNNTTKPKNWQTDVWTLGTDSDNLYYRYLSGSRGEGLKNEDFIVWMRTAAFPTFRKLYRKVERTNDNYVSAGEKTLLIYYNYPVTSFGGEKFFVLATTSWIGGKNFFLGYTYVITGALCLVVMAILFLISRRNN